MHRFVRLESMERTVIRFQEPSNALWLSSHFVKKIDQAWVLLVGSNSVVARAIYGSTQAIKRTTPSFCPCMVPWIYYYTFSTSI